MLVSNILHWLAEMRIKTWSVLHKDRFVSSATTFNQHTHKWHVCTHYFTLIHTWICPCCYQSNKWNFQGSCVALVAYSRFLYQTCNFLLVCLSNTRTVLIHNRSHSWSHCSLSTSWQSVNSGCSWRMVVGAGGCRTKEQEIQRQNFPKPHGRFSVSKTSKLREVK